MITLRPAPNDKSSIWHDGNPIVTIDLTDPGLVILNRAWIDRIDARLAELRGPATAGRGKA